MTVPASSVEIINIRTTNEPTLLNYLLNRKKANESRRTLRIKCTFRLVMPDLATTA